MTVNTSDRMKQITQAIEDHIADTGRLPSTTDIIDKVDSPQRSIRDDLDKLVEQGKITVAYETPKNPKIYIPTYMYDAVLRVLKEPSWMPEYSFSKVTNLKNKIRKNEEELTKLKCIERLLYATGRGLEEAVEKALQILEVDDLQCPYEKPDSWDIDFTLDGMSIVADVKGKSRWVDKPDVAQLSQWLKKFIDEYDEVDPEKIQGLLIVNSFRDEVPSERWPKNDEQPPITKTGERYLKLDKLRFLTTSDLFFLTKDVIEGRMVKKEAREKLTTLFKNSL